MQEYIRLYASNAMAFSSWKNEEEDLGFEFENELKEAGLPELCDELLEHVGITKRRNTSYV